MKNKIRQISGRFRSSSGFPRVLSKSGAELLFDGAVSSALLRERFGIASENKERFDSAFRAVTEGAGKEITKINSVVSSALLQLLVFYKLYIPKEGEAITISAGHASGVFTRAFFEVRNKVVRGPSCVDVALVSADGETILFLKSKLTEMFMDSTDRKTYRPSYKPLYGMTGIKSALSGGGIAIDEEAPDLVLLSSRGPQYLEGVKQTLSHLIGLVKGPQLAKDQADYISAYRRARRLVYSPLLYDTTALFQSEPDECSAFSALYSGIFGKHGDAVLKDIQDRTGTDCGKTVEIHPRALTYQNLISENPDWLDTKVKTFYSL